MKSMTGFGSAQADAVGYHIVVELKSVNGRFLKISTKLPASLAFFEVELETLLKTRLRRGSVNVSVYLRDSAADALVTVNEPVVRAYQEIFARLGLAHESMAHLPGVLGPPRGEREELPPELAPAVTACVREALENLVQMRAREGAALVTVLRDLCDSIDAARLAVRGRAPHVVADYQQRLRQRLATLLAGVDSGNIDLDPQLLAREVALFADRSDVTEEVDRLAAHLQQVRALFVQDGEAGRTLEFLAQEMHREVNTIGSKSVDAELSRWVVGLKADVERFKEQVANVE